MKVRLRSLLPSRGRDGNSHGNQNKKRSGASRRSLAVLAKAKSRQQGGGGGGLLDGVTVGIIEGSSRGSRGSPCGTGGSSHALGDEGAWAVDTSIETTLDSVADLLNATDNTTDSTTDDSTRGKLQLGPERTVTFHSPNLGLQLARGPDGRVRVQSLTPSSDRTDPTMSGTIRTGDVVLEMAGTDLRRPIDAEGWSRAVARVKRGTGALPVTFIVAEERHRAATAAAGKETKTTTTTTVPAVEIEVDLANAVSTSMDIRTSNTWEMEQSKAEWVEAEKRQQLEEEKARLMGMEATAAANDDSVEMGIDELRRMLWDGAASAVADVFGSGTQGPGEEKKEAEEEVAKEAKASVPPTTTEGGRLSNPIDLDEIPSDLSSIGNGNIDDDDDNGDKEDKDGTDIDKDNEERQMMASAQAEAARAALWKQAANRSGGNAEGTAAASGNEENGGNTNDNTNDDNDDDEGIVELNRINTAMFERLHQGGQQPMIAAREITGMSSLGRDRSLAGQSLTGSYTDVSENHMMESFLFLNRDVVAAAGPDDDIDNDYDEGGKEASKKNGVAIGKRRGNNHDFFEEEEEEDSYANCNNITCQEHLVNRIDDVVCSGVVCNALPEQLLGNGEGDDSEDENKDET